jgi:hypothetical protein
MRDWPVTCRACVPGAGQSSAKINMAVLSVFDPQRPKLNLVVT